MRHLTTSLGGRSGRSSSAAECHNQDHGAFRPALWSSTAAPFGTPTTTPPTWIDLGSHAITNDANVTVDGTSSLKTPTVQRVSVASAPRNDHTYSAGETIAVEFEFDQELVITGGLGRLGLTLTIGDVARQASHYLRPDHNLVGRNIFLNFAYTVQAGDLDTDGVGTPANAIALNGGTVVRGIRGLPTPIPADLSHQAMPDQANHKVDGGTAVPAVPFAGLIALGLMLAGISGGLRRRQIK